MDGSLNRADAITSIRQLTSDFSPIMCDALISDFEEFITIWKYNNKEVIEIIRQAYVSACPNTDFDEKVAVPKAYFDVIELLRKYIAPSNTVGVGNNADKAGKLPSELDNPEARRIFQKAIELGLMSEDYKWLKGLQLLACFAREMSLKFKLGKGINSAGTQRVSWKPFELLFNIEEGKLRANFSDIQKTGQQPTDHTLIDKIFK